VDRAEVETGVKRQRIALSAGGTLNKPECDGYGAGTDAQFNVVARVGIWPPAGLAEMLNVSVATPLDPDEVSVVDASPSR